MLAVEDLEAEADLEAEEDSEAVEDPKEEMNMEPNTQTTSPFLPPKLAWSLVGSMP